MGLWACGLFEIWDITKRGNRVKLLQDVLPQHGVLQHHGVQCHHGWPHVPLACGLRPNYYALTSRSLFEVQDALSTDAEVHVVHYGDLELQGAGGHIDGFWLHSEVTQYFWSSLKEAHRPKQSHWLSFELWGEKKIAGSYTCLAYAAGKKLLRSVVLSCPRAMKMKEKNPWIGQFVHIRI